MVILIGKNGNHFAPVLNHKVFEYRDTAHGNSNNSIFNFIIKKKFLGV